MARGGCAANIQVTVMAEVQKYRYTLPEIPKEKLPCPTPKINTGEIWKFIGHSYDDERTLWRYPGDFDYDMNPASIHHGEEFLVLELEFEKSSFWIRVIVSDSGSIGWFNVNGWTYEEELESVWTK